MANLLKASHQLFSRKADETFEDIPSLHRACLERMSDSGEFSVPANQLSFESDPNTLTVNLCTSSNTYSINSWAFSQLCRMAGAEKRTINRLSSHTAAVALNELFSQRASAAGSVRSLVTLKEGKPDAQLRAVTSNKYSRIWDSQVVDAISKAAPHYAPPKKGFNGATGLYTGEQDMFMFLVDPDTRVELDVGGQNQEFSPGFFVWNSEVGSRSVGIETFWYQYICANHIVWDATEVQQVVRRHVGNSQRILSDISYMVEDLIRISDLRKDAFVTKMRAAENTDLGYKEEVLTLLQKQGYSKKASEMVTDLIEETSNRFSAFSVVDAMTRLSQNSKFAGSRADLDRKASAILALV